MPLIALVGLGSGALHALAGPDHLLSLAPLSFGRRRGAWRVGLLWGIGHSLGTLAAAVVMILVLSSVQLEGIDRWAEAVAGAALIGMGVWGLKRRNLGNAQAVTSGVLTVGLIHGLTGAAALLMILPAAVSESGVHRALYLGGFSLGSTVAMAALTAGLAAFSRRGRLLSERAGSLVTRTASPLSIVLGGVWVVGSL